MQDYLSNVMRSLDIDMVDINKTRISEEWTLVHTLGDLAEWAIPRRLRVGVGVGELFRKILGFVVCAIMLAP